MMVIELKVPPVGESIREVQIAHWRKGVGEHFDRDEQLVELETDKATVELPAPDAGVLAKILKQEGEIVAVGEVIAHLQADADGPRGVAAKEAKSEQPASKPTPREPLAAPTAPAEESAATAEQDTGNEPEPWAVPSARRALHKYGLKPADIEPSGRGGRLTESDVEGFAREHQLADSKSAPPAPTPQPAAEKKAAPTTIVEAKPTAEVTDDEERIVPMSIIRRRIAERLVEAQHQAALLTTYNEVDMSEVIDARKRYQELFEKKYQVKLGFMSFFVKATIDALRQFPALNAEVRGTNIVYRDAYHIGVAIGSGKGLVVPVLHHAERMSFAEIEQQIRDYAERANQGKIRPQDLERGTFTISNGGVYGSMLSTPIVNPPQSGVLGMHAIQQRPVARDNQVVIRPIMYLALTYDHRLVDGREAVTFLKRIQEAIEDPARMLLEI